jgi:GNAT superfamily N-acetyltransferase
LPEIGEHPRCVNTTDLLAVRLLDSAASRDADLVDELTTLVNRVYVTAESGLWRDGTTRTTAAEIAEFVCRSEVAVATRNGRLVGSVHVHDVADDASEFGLLVSAPEQRGTGVGRALVDFVERSAYERGLRAIQLELLVPRAWRHPTKEFLKSWYGRRGYRVVRVGTLDAAYPHLAPLLATPCDLVIHEKPVQGPQPGD